MTEPIIVEHCTNDDIGIVKFQEIVSLDVASWDVVPYPEFDGESQFHETYLLKAPSETGCYQFLYFVHTLNNQQDDKPILEYLNKRGDIVAQFEGANVLRAFNQVRALVLKHNGETEAFVDTTLTLPKFVLSDVGTDEFGV